MWFIAIVDNFYSFYYEVNAIKLTFFFCINKVKVKRKISVFTSVISMPYNVRVIKVGIFHNHRKHFTYIKYLFLIIGHISI